MRGLNIKTDKLMAFYTPGGNQKPGTAIQKYESATDRSDSP